MIYLNDDLGVFGKLFSDIYQATTVQDFINNKKEIPIQPILRRLSPLSFINGDSIIVFTDTNLRFKNEGYEIYDMTGELYVEPYIHHFTRMPDSAKHENIIEGMFYSIILRYSVKMDRISLYDTKKIGPPELDKLKVNLEELVFAQS